MSHDARPAALFISMRLEENKGAYIRSWLGAIKDDRKMLIVVAAQAQKAADYILAVKEADSAGTSRGAAPDELAEAA